jgi:two-component system response regulator AtoC
LEKLAAYEWPGNVRELENVIEHAMALADGDWIGSEDIPNQLLIALFADNSHTDAIGPVSIAKKNFEASVQRLYAEALRSENGNVPRAAELLGMSRATFYRRLKKYDLGDLVSQLRL